MIKSRGSYFIASLILSLCVHKIADYYFKGLTEGNPYGWLTFGLLTLLYAFLKPEKGEDDE